MKYRLKPCNRGAEDEVLLDDLRRVAALAPKVRLTGELYAKHGRFHPSTVSRRFGTWNAALTKAGLRPSKFFAVAPDEALDDLKRLAKLLHAETLRRQDYDAHGRFSSTTVARQLGGWLRALSEAGLAPSCKYKVPDEAWFQNIARVWDHHGRQPSYADMARPPSTYSPAGYAYRFGSWRRALEAFVGCMKTEASEDAVIESCDLLAAPKTKPDRPKGPRAAGWKLTFLVYRRDNYRCRACGRSTSDGVKLNVDHIIPWSNGGKTKLENLQTLCDKCNSGKSNLDWESQA